MIDLSLTTPDGWLGWIPGDSNEVLGAFADDPRVPDEAFATIRHLVEGHDAGVARLEAGQFALMWAPEGLPIGQGYIALTAWSEEAPATPEAIIAQLDEYAPQPGEKVFTHEVAQLEDSALGPAVVRLLIASTAESPEATVTCGIWILTESTDVISVVVSTPFPERDEDLMDAIGPLVDGIGLAHT
ncbi:hypothetical protein [Demequina sp. NBRC 110051]|uniref:hypothetical protein n=1 Tax=Demequina sp. NBRC 110051 TaxID=1570340 RepID=UPI0009FF95C2|nr:hypothetical protein [Demequina sp. NBRC 110051]